MKKKQGDGLIQTKITSVGTDTLKVNPKFFDEDSKPLKVQDLPEHCEAMFSVWQEQALTKLKPVPTTATFHGALMTMLPNCASAWKYQFKALCSLAFFGVHFVLRQDAFYSSCITIDSSFSQV